MLFLKSCCKKKKKNMNNSELYLTFGVSKQEKRKKDIPRKFPLPHLTFALMPSYGSFFFW